MLLTVQQGGDLIRRLWSVYVLEQEDTIQQVCTLQRQKYMLFSSYLAR